MKIINNLVAEEYVSHKLQALEKKIESEIAYLEEEKRNKLPDLLTLLVGVGFSIFCAYVVGLFTKYHLAAIVLVLVLAFFINVCISEKRKRVSDKIKKLAKDKIEMQFVKIEDGIEEKLSYVKLKEMEYGRFDEYMKTEIFIDLRNAFEKGKLLDVPLSYIYEDYEECGGLSICLVFEENDNKKLISVCEKDVAIQLDESDSVNEKTIMINNDKVELTFSC